MHKRCFAVEVLVVLQNRPSYVLLKLYVFYVCKLFLYDVPFEAAFLVLVLVRILQSILVVKQVLGYFDVAGSKFLLSAGCGLRRLRLDRRLVVRRGRCRCLTVAQHADVQCNSCKK